MSVKLGAVQHRIMRVLWERERATAREITDDLSRHEEIAHSTVQTLLRKLEAKGAVKHLKEDRTFVFEPLVREDEVQQSAAQDLINRVFRGSLTGLVAHLIEQEEVSEKELAELRTLIEEKQR